VVIHGRVVRLILRLCARTTSICSRCSMTVWRAVEGVRDTETLVYLHLTKQTYSWGTR